MITSYILFITLFALSLHNGLSDLLKRKTNALARAEEGLQPMPHQAAPCSANIVSGPLMKLLRNNSGQFSPQVLCSVTDGSPREHPFCPQPFCQGKQTAADRMNVRGGRGEAIRSCQALSVAVKRRRGCRCSWERASARRSRRSRARPPRRAGPP